MLHPALPHIDVRWLIDPDRAATPEVIPADDKSQRLDYPIPPDIGHGHLYRLALGEDFSLFRGVHRFRAGMDRRLIPLGQFDIDLPCMTLVMQSVQGGGDSPSRAGASRRIGLSAWSRLLSPRRADSGHALGRDRLR